MAYRKITTKYDSTCGNAGGKGGSAPGVGVTIGKKTKPKTVRGDKTGGNKVQTFP